jgi:hypothetical protein
MPRPQIPAGELGRIQVTQLSSGRYRVRASTGMMAASCTAWRQRTRRKRKRAEFRRQVAALSTGGTVGLAPSSTIDTVVEAWLAQILTRARAGSLAFSTYESYETTARVIMLPPVRRDVHCGILSTSRDEVRHLKGAPVHTLSGGHGPIARLPAAAHLSTAACF